MAIKKGDFIQINYTAKEKDTEKIVDTTNENLAKDNKIYQENAKYGPVTICLGFNDVIKGIDEFLIGKSEGDYKISLEPEKAFGKKIADLIKLMPLSMFNSSNIKPSPGLQLDLDGMLCTIRSVSGGRVLVDFNHPLAGKPMDYEIKVDKMIKETKDKINSLLNMRLNKFKIKNLKEEELEIECEIKKEFEDVLSKEIKEKLPELKNIKFINTKN